MGIHKLRAAGERQEMNWRSVFLLSLCLSSGLSSPDTYVVVKIPSPSDGEATGVKDIKHLLNPECLEAPNVTGPCRARAERWTFRGGRCLKFIYGGCRGTGNNFKSKRECERKCIPDKPMPMPRQ